MHRAVDAVGERGLHDHAAAVEVGAADLVRSVERQRGGAVHDESASRHGTIHGRAVPDVPGADADAVDTVGVIEGCDVEGRHLVTAVEQLAHEVDSEETGASGHQDALIGRLSHGSISLARSRLVTKWAD